jgi:hypothetical protein
MENRLQSPSFAPSAQARPIPRSGTEILVSVVMPCLDEARTLAGCIAQARAGCEAAVAERAGAEYSVPRASQPLENAKTPHEQPGNHGPQQPRLTESPPLPITQSPYLPNATFSPLPIPTFPPLLRGDQGGFPNNARPANNASTGASPHFRYEIIVADNGSRDGSQTLAERAGARVVPVPQRGYGAALQGGIAAAGGKYVVMADADGSYDFGEVPRFVAKLEEGYDLVMGNRFAGGIEPGAMPWHHRYIGNPVLSGIGRLLFRPACRDFHCGLRAFVREKIIALGLESPGMEFATEMVIRAAQKKLRITEIPIVLHPDGRDRPPHLKSFRDGWRHLRLMVAALFQVTRNYQKKS